MAKIAAVVLGVILAFILLSSIFSDTSSDTSFAREMFVRLGIVAVLYAAFGGAFGLCIPRPTWSWGFWVSVPTLVLFTFFIPIYLSSIVAENVDFGRAQDRMEDLMLFGFFAGALVAACLGAYAGAQARHYFFSE
jgi:hypothetical protein